MEFGEINGAEQSSTRAGRFSEFIQLFYMLGKHEKLFPKICRTCGTEYHSFSEFLQGTRPLAHGLQDASEVMHTPYTLQYRNCTCGSTLVLSLTAETYRNWTSSGTCYRRKRHVPVSRSVRWSLSFGSNAIGTSLTGYSKRTNPRGIIPW